MSNCWSKTLAFVAVLLFVSVPVAADQRGGDRHGGGGGGNPRAGRAPSGGHHRSGGSALHRAQQGRSSGRAPGHTPSHSQGATRRTPRNQPAARHHNFGPSPYGGRYIGPRYPYYGPWHHGHWHDHWVRPWPRGPVAWWSVGFVSGALVWDAPWNWGYWSYYNPYYTEVVVVENTMIDYSQPIALKTAPVPESVAATVAENQAVQLLNASRAAFARGDYASAISLVNQSIAKNPGDPVAHEFRALILFATKKYSEAASALYAVLSMGPGWDWATMSSFYPNVATYTAQLRALERYRNDHLSAPEARFLLAYHYMCCGHPDAAASELREVVRLNPKDQLSSQLLAGLTGGEQGESIAPPEPAAQTPPRQPVDAASLVGDWTAARPDGDTFVFKLNADSTYSWRYTHVGKTQEFGGAYTVADDLLILKQNGTPVMIGQIAMLDGGRFNFKLAGDNPNDPGLTFSRK